MPNSVCLLDTPERASLTEQSQNLRAALKTFEHSFASQHGRKPSKNDIRNDPFIAEKYKDYQRVQDMLSGKLAYERLLGGKSRTKAHSRKDSGIGSSPRADQFNSPRKQQKAEDAESPRVLLKTAIGPTPHRDGKVLGLFDLLPSGSSAALSTGARKRKIDALYLDSPERSTPLKMNQTPSKRSEKRDNDILKYLQGTPEKAASTRERSSRTPQSEGRKFQLSQFFATPSTQRILFGNTTEDDQVIQGSPNQTPQKPLENKDLDTTPAYLKRSISFKDRLLSASRPSSPKFAQPRRFNTTVFPPPHALEISGIREISLSKPELRNDDEYDDDLDALRDAEGNGDSRPQIQVQDSQPTESMPLQEISQPVYKKKGQKRTTKKTHIKPVHLPQPISRPKFVAAENSDDDGDFDPEGTENLEDITSSGVDGSKEVTRYASKGAKNNQCEKAGTKKTVGMINPNAQSHMNFRTLKIKNKNSRAKNAGKRFGSRR